MDWITGVFIGTGGLYVLIFSLLFISYKRRSVGLGMFSRTSNQIEGVNSKRIAPAPFYYKQRIFRWCYFSLHALDKLLLVTSLAYSALTAYLILDSSVESSVSIACLVVSTVTSTLKTTLGLDKMAKPYIAAVRLLEIAILQYEYSDSAALSDDPETPPNASQYQILLDANAAAERLISQDYE